MSETRLEEGKSRKIFQSRDRFVRIKDQIKQWHLRSKLISLVAAVLLGNLPSCLETNLQSISGFQVSLINMAHKCYAGKVKYVDTVLEVTKRLFDNINLDK